MQLSPESGNDDDRNPGSMFGWIRPNLPDSGRTPPDSVRSGGISGRIPAILARSGQISSRIRSYPAGLVSGSGQIRPDSGHFGWIRTVSVNGRILANFCWNLVLRHSMRLPDVSGFRQPAVFRRPNSDIRHGSIPVAGFRNWHNPSDLMMLDSSAA